jgi:hypothetical protein
MRRLLAPIAALLSGMLLALLIAEAAMHCLPVVSGRIRSSDESRWPLHNYEPGTEYTYSFGWDMRLVHHGRINNFGQLAPFDYVKGASPIAVLGDSYVESAMNAYSDTLQAQLSRQLGRSDAAIGVAGTGLSLADHAVLAGQLQEELAPKALVLVVIDGDIADSVTRRRGWNHLRAPAPGRNSSLVFKPLRSGQDSWASGLGFRSALYRYLRRNVGWQPPSWHTALARLTAQPAAMEAASPKPSNGALQTAVEQLLDELLHRSRLPARCIAMVVDSDRAVLYGRKATPAVDAPALREHLIAQATLRGMRVQDMGPHFAEHYRTHRRAFDHSPLDRHWNALGHELAAQAAMQALAECPEATAGRRSQSTQDVR